jgi:hypothetical protein
VLVATGRDLSLRGLDVGASDPTAQPTRFDLLQVYVDLLTIRQAIEQEGGPLRGRQENEESPQGPRTLSALEAAASYRRMVLLGDPGSGKSTFITNFTLALALHRLDPAHDWLDRLRGWPAGESRLLPITVVLRDFIAASPAVTSQATPSRLWDFIVARLDEQNLRFAAGLLEEKMERGHAIVFLDGLDEIGDPRQQSSCARPYRPLPVATRAHARWSPVAPSPIRTRAGGLRASSRSLWRRSTRSRSIASLQAGIASWLAWAASRRVPPPRSPAYMDSSDLQAFRSLMTAVGERSCSHIPARC